MPFKDKERKREYDRNYSKKKHDRRRGLGLCYDCEQPRASNFQYCLFHLDKRRQNHRKHIVEIRKKDKIKHHTRYYKYKSENRCVHCGMPLNNESRMGVSCLNCYMMYN